MRCPFLRKTSVKYCGLYRHAMVPLEASALATDQCATPGYRDCPLVQEHHEGQFPPDRCPYLSVGDFCYCQAGPVRKPIPCNQAILSRCKDGGHEHCSVFLANSHPASAENTAAGSAVPSTDPEIAQPEHLAYSRNHFWLDRSCGRTCHIGVDEFLCRVLGGADSIQYLSHGGNRRPAIRFRRSGVDFDLVFPNVLQGTETNPLVLVDPDEVFADPYGRGWLFEGFCLSPHDSPDGGGLEAGLLRDGPARRWLSDETLRLSDFVTRNAPVDEGADEPERSPWLRVSELCDRPTLVRLHDEFFSLNPERTCP